MKKLIIFDLDGTILNTLDDLASSLNYALKTNNIKERTIQEVKSFIGDGIRLLVERGVPLNTNKEITDKVFNDFKAHYKLNASVKTKPYDGIIPLLNKLKSKGIKLAVASNKADFILQELCHKYFLNLFDIVAGERDGIAKKPSPDLINYVLKELSIDTNDSLYIGDSEVDIKTSDNALMDYIIVDWGFRDKEYLIKCNPKIMVSSINELENLLIK